MRRPLPTVKPVSVGIGSGAPVRGAVGSPSGTHPYGCGRLRSSSASGTPKMKTIADAIMSVSRHPNVLTNSAITGTTK